MSTHKKVKDKQYNKFSAGFLGKLLLQVIYYSTSRFELKERFKLKVPVIFSKSQCPRAWKKAVVGRIATNIETLLIALLSACSCTLLLIKMFVCIALYLIGLILVRLTSAVLAAWDPFELIAEYSILRNITTDDLDNEYSNLYFQDMCNFFSAAFVNSYIGLYVPTATPLTNYQVYVDTGYTILAMLCLQETFFFGRYCYKIILIASAFGAFWGIVMVSIIHWLCLCYHKEPIKKLTACCGKCCKQHETEQNNCDNPVVEPLNRNNIYVY